MSITEIVVLLLIITLPILITAIGACYSELSGVVNIGLEGMMLIGAFSAAATAYSLQQHFMKSPNYGTGEMMTLFALIIGMLSGMFFGGLTGLLHALVSIKFKGNQIVSGVAINLFASGITLFLLKELYNQSSGTKSISKPGNVNTVFLILMVVVILLIAFASHIIINKTVFGLRLRTVGEHPLAADTVGINVERLRYQGVIISGILAGLGGAFLSIGQLTLFQKEMTAGRGYIALAAMIFGKWKPIPTILASFFFGAGFLIKQIIISKNLGFPTEFVEMLPYIFTLLVLAGVVGKARAPKASGIPYEKK